MKSFDELSPAPAEDNERDDPRVPYVEDDVAEEEVVIRTQPTKDDAAPTRKLHWAGIAGRKSHFRPLPWSPIVLPRTKKPAPPPSPKLCRLATVVAVQKIGGPQDGERDGVRDDAEQPQPPEPEQEQEQEQPLRRQPRSTDEAVKRAPWCSEEPAEDERETSCLMRCLYSTVQCCETFSLL